MSVFTPTEIAYLQSQRLGRIATVGVSGQPHVVPVGLRYNAVEDTEIGGPAEVLASGGEAFEANRQSAKVRP